MKTKKIFSIILALTMVLSTGTISFGEEDMPIEELVLEEITDENVVVDDIILNIVTPPAVNITDELPITNPDEELISDENIDLEEEVVVPEFTSEPAINIEVEELDDYIFEDLDGLGREVFIDAPFIEHPSRTLKRVAGLKVATLQTNEPIDNNIADGLPGAITINKTATPVTNTNDQWEINLTLTGIDVPGTSDIVLLIDRSGSMKDGRLKSAQEAAINFINTLLTENKPGIRIAVISFAGDVRVDSGFEDFNNKQILINTVNDLKANGGTFIQAGVRQASAVLNSSTADKKSIVLLGDGAATYSYGLNKPNDYLEYWKTPYFNPYKRTTSNMPSAAFNNSVVGNGSDSHSSYATRKYYRHGASAIAEAGFAKTKGQTIYSISLQAGTEGEYTLDGISSSGSAVKATQSNLSNIFQAVASDISNAATNAIITDPLGSMFLFPGFDIHDPVANITVDRGTVTWNGIALMWNLGSISDSEAKMTYRVKIKPEAVSKQLYPTNGITFVTYQNKNNDTAIKMFPIPEVSIERSPVTEPDKTGTIIISKSFSDNTSPSGIKFKIIGDEGYTDTQTANDDGIATFNEVPFDSYTLEELNLGENYTNNLDILGKLKVDSVESITIEVINTKKDIPILKPGFEIRKKGTYEDTDKNGKLNIGDRVEYQIAIKNVGNVNLTDIAIIDELLGYETTVELLAIEEFFVSDSIWYTLTDNDIAQGFVVNIVLGKTGQLEEEFTLKTILPINPTPPTKPSKPNRPNKPTEPNIPPITVEPELPPIVIEPEPGLPPIIETPIIPPVVEVPEPSKPIATLPKTGSGIDVSILGAGLLTLGVFIRKFKK